MPIPTEKRYRFIVLMVIAFTWPGHSQTHVQNNPQRETSWERKLYKQYVSFLDKLDSGRIEKEYPAAIRNIQSEDSDSQKQGLQVLAASGEIGAIGWIIQLLDSEHSDVRIHAGLALEQIVSRNELLRRNMKYPEEIVLLPRSPGDADLRPLGWIILKMMRAPDDGNTAAYAATIAGYLGLSEFEWELKRLLESRHPAVRRSATNALEMIGSYTGNDQLIEHQRSEHAEYDNVLSGSLTPELFISQKFIAYTDLWAVWLPDGDPIVFHADSAVDNERAGLQGKWKVLDETTVMIAGRTFGYSSAKSCLFSPLKLSADIGWYILLEADKQQWLHRHSKVK